MYLSVCNNGDGVTCDNIDECDGLYIDKYTIDAHNCHRNVTKTSVTVIPKALSNVDVQMTSSDIFCRDVNKCSCSNHQRRENVSQNVKILLVHSNVLMSFPVKIPVHVTMLLNVSVGLMSLTSGC